MKGKQLILFLAGCLLVSACSSGEGAATEAVTSSPAVAAAEESMAAAAVTAEESTAVHVSVDSEPAEPTETSAAEAVLSHDFDSSTNHSKVMNRCRFQIPEGWQETSSSDDLYYYYPTGAVMMVQYLDGNTTDFTVQANREAYLDVLAQSYADYRLIRTFDEEIASRQVFRYSFSGLLQGQPFLMDGAVIALDEGIYNFLFGTLQPAAIDYSEDFQAILRSIEIDEPETETEAKTTAAESRTAETAAAQTTEKAAETEKVWVSANGKKYHKSPDCSNMKSPSQITIEDAEASGRGPCKKCY